MPKISIIISTYNDANFLPKALDSVFAQSFTDFELLIFNDASTDNTELILSDYQKKDARVVVTNNKIRLGLTANLNTALVASKGKYIARLDSDDQWLDIGKLQKQFDYLEQNPGYGLVGSWAEFVAGDGKKLYDFKPPATDAKIRKELLLHNCFVHSSIMANKQLVLQVGGYDPSQQYIEDYGLWLRLGTVCKLANLPEIMVRYRVNPLGITRTKNAEQVKAAFNLIKTQRNNYPGFFKAAVKWMLQTLIKS